jgi:excisionase family DNA binding protein
MGQQDIVSIKKASQLLGVTEATLRQWTDEGKLKAFVTPGGHRRYFQADLKKLTRPSQKLLGIKDLAAEIKDTTESHREIARKFVGSRADVGGADGEHGKILALLGHKLLDLIIKYISEPARREETINGARQIGQSFGNTLIELKLPLSAAVEAFIQHREPIVNSVAHLIRKRELVGVRILESYALVNRILDETLIGLVATYDNGTKMDKKS